MEAPNPRPAEEVVHQVCRYLEAHADAKLTLADLARWSGYSPAHLQRSFKAVTGCSPKEYQQALRTQRLKQELRAGTPPSQAVYGAGFGSPSRVYGALDSTLAMTPVQYQRGGRGLDLHWALAPSPLGPLLLAASDRGLAFLHFAASAEEGLSALAAEFPQARVRPMPEASRPEFDRWMAAVRAFLGGHGDLAGLPLDIRGTAFQVAVWTFLQTIPRGETRSYTQVAAALDRPAAVRAVASACARNHLALVIPCHRVLRGDGALAGYRWGMERKRRLLELEQGAAAG